MHFLIKHTSLAGLRTELVTIARDGADAHARALRLLGPALACTCLCLHRLSPAQRSAIGA